MNIFKALFGTPKVIEAAISAGDALIFTDQERKDWLIRFHEVSSGSRVARRMIAVIVTGLWATLILLAALLWHWWPDWSAYMLELMGEAVQLPLTAVVSFYFATAAVRAAKNGK